MPDRVFVRRREGVLAPNRVMFNLYDQQADEDEVDFDNRLQKLLVNELIVASSKQGCELHYAATESTHIHVLVSWKTMRDWKQFRTGLKSSMTRRLNLTICRRSWFSQGASRKQVNSQEHFDHLINQYLPGHSGWKWKPDRGMFR